MAAFEVAFLNTEKTQETKLCDLKKALILTSDVLCLMFLFPSNTSPQTLA